MYRPLDHFKIITLLSLTFCPYSFYIFDNVFFLIFLIYFFLALLSRVIYKYKSIFFNFFFLFYLWVYKFVKLLIEENIGQLFLRLLFVLFHIFLLIFLSNYFGMIPFSLTITSHLIVTFYIALSVFFGINYFLIKYKKLSLFELFLPNGTPLVISPFLILIELISYIARVFSLSIRLFANMMAGHTLLAILSIFFIKILVSGSFFTFLSLMPGIVIFLVMILESCISFLQAYVFLMLICIYINDVFHLH